MYLATLTKLLYDFAEIEKFKCALYGMIIYRISNNNDVGYVMFQQTQIFHQTHITKSRGKINEINLSRLVPCFG